MNAPLLVFSHLRWDSIRRRPHHLMTRMARRRRVLYVEEPLYDGCAAAWWETWDPLPGLRVCRPRTPATQPGFSDPQIPTLQRMVNDLLLEEEVRSPVAWLTTAMAEPLARVARPAAVVYDCMSEISTLLLAPQELRQREAELMGLADLVFTAGPSLYHLKRGSHRNVHCFASSVDMEHFAGARAALDEPQDQGAIPRPRLGFFGTVDERVDLGLVTAVCDAHPEWQLVLVGPFDEAAREQLPGCDNLHVLGARDYADLPRYVAGWDVCLLPYVNTAATRASSPTKTLEYMAAGKPIVSTPLPDVADPYGDIVYLGATPQAFVSACERALGAPALERDSRLARVRTVLRMTSWDATVEAMDDLIEALERDRRRAGREPQLDAAPARIP